MPNITIRAVRPSDYPALAEACRASGYGASDIAESLLEEDEENQQPPLKFKRFVAEVDGQVVGYMGYFQPMSRYHPQNFWLDGYVHPHYQRRGIGSALAQRIEAALAAHNPIQVRSATREDFAHSLDFLKGRGLTEGKRTWVSHLDVAACDLTPFQGVIERVEAQGIRLTTLAELQGQPGWEQKALDQYNEIQADIPDIDPAAQVGMQQFQKSRLQSPGCSPTPTSWRWMATGGSASLRCGVRRSRAAWSWASPASPGLTGGARSRWR